MADFNLDLLVKMLNLMTSPNDAEALAATRKACAYMKSHNKTFDQLMKPSRPSRPVPGSAFNPAGGQGFPTMQEFESLLRGVAREFGAGLGEQFSPYEPRPRRPRRN